MNIALFGTVLLAVVVAWALIAPHLQAAEESGSSTAGASLQTLLDQKNRCMQLLKDLELDFSTGKLADGDYAKMKGSLSRELGLLMTRIDESRVG